jgi:O-succinylbenzoate synthase
VSELAIPTSPVLAHVDRIVAFAVPLTTRFRGVSVRHGLLLHGPAGWGEWYPFDD